MKVTLISGSPKKKGSASETLLSIIKSYLTQEDIGQGVSQKGKQRSSCAQDIKRQTDNQQIGETEDKKKGGEKTHNQEVQINKLQLWQPQIDKQHIKELLESDSIVFAFPLYIDSIPSHLLRCLMQIEAYIQDQRIQSSLLSKVNIYVIVNNGFFQGKQNVLAIEVMQHWAKRCGFCFRQAVGIGGGGMIHVIQSIPDGHGPKKNISIALKEMAENIIQSKSGTVRFLEPNYPAWAYKWQAEFMWRAMIKKNGLKKKEIHKQW